MIAVPADWTGGIEDLVAEANRWLADLLPADRAARPKDEVNPRLVRHYTTQGLLPAPRREGRDARYSRVHLMALLALRRLMADGLGGKALDAALGGRDEQAFERLAVDGALEGGGEPAYADNAALRYIRELAQAAGHPVAGQSAAGAARPRLPTPGEQREAAPLPAFLLTPQRAGREGRINRTTRAVVRLDLELLIGSDFEWPQSEPQWRSLLREIGATLRDAQQSGE